MDHAENNQDCNLLKKLQAPAKKRSLESAHVAFLEEVEAEDTATISGEVSGEEIQSSPQSSQRASPLCNFLGSTAEVPYGKASGIQMEDVEDPYFPSEATLNAKIIEMLRFLFLKYHRKQLVSEIDMIDMVKNYKEYYPLIFSKVYECMRLIFGINMIEVDPADHSYILVTALGITYDGLLHGAQGIPKTGLLIVILGTIFIENNCISENKFWCLLNKMGLYAGKYHFIFGEPRKLIFEDFVRERYLQYRQVPDSNPPCHEILWGPRVYVETTKMKILSFFARVTGRNPKSYPTKYAEALSEELERT
ncbi:hypothetical protein HispidOSU_010944 [Sigmodon hispidus]